MTGLALANLAERRKKIIFSSVTAFSDDDIILHGATVFRLPLKADHNLGNERLTELIKRTAAPTKDKVVQQINSYVISLQHARPLERSVSFTF